MTEPVLRTRRWFIGRAAGVVAAAVVAPALLRPEQAAADADVWQRGTRFPPLPDLVPFDLDPYITADRIDLDGAIKYEDIVDLMRALERPKGPEFLLLPYQAAIMQALRVPLTPLGQPKGPWLDLSGFRSVEIITSPAVPEDRMYMIYEGMFGYSPRDLESRLGLRRSAEIVGLSV